MRSSSNRTRKNQIEESEETQEMENESDLLCKNIRRVDSNVSELSETSSSLPNVVVRKGDDDGNLFEMEYANSNSDQNIAESSCDSANDDELHDVEKEMKLSKIFKNVSQYLTFKDHKNLRLISKQWNNALIPQLQKRCNKSVELYPTNLNKFLTSMSSATTSQMPQMMIITKYKIAGVSLHQDDLKLLFNSCGHAMTHLSISIPRPSPSFTSSKFRSMLMPCTQLVKLKLFDDRDLNWRTTITSQQWANSRQPEDSEKKAQLHMLDKLQKIQFNLFGLHGEEGETFLTELFNAAPNLESMEINHKEETGYAEHNAATMIALKTTTTTLVKLKIMHFNQFKFQDLSTLIDLSTNHGLCLTQLNLHLLNPKPHEDVNMFHEFLSLQSDSMKILCINTEAKRSTLIVQIPSMKVLETFQISYYLKAVTLRSSSFCETSFPKLKKLVFINPLGAARDDDELETTGSHKWNSFTTSLCLVPTLEKLNLDFGLDSLDQMIKLGQLFPNLIKLRICLKDVGLIRKIWSQWPNLQGLSISSEDSLSESDDDDSDDESDDDDDENDQVDDGFLDELITGIPTKFHKLLNTWSQTKPLGLLEVLNTMKTQPGVTDMKYLTKLKLCLDNLSSTSFITDISGYYGFALPTIIQLTSLYIDSSVNKISDACKDFIRGSLGSDAIIFIE